jgi:hypothetical protein
METLKSVLDRNVTSDGLRPTEARTITQTSCASAEIPGLYATLDGWLSVIPLEYRDISLQKCDKLPPKLLEYGENWFKSFPLKSLYLFGEYGSGKTTFSFAVIRALMELWARKVYIWPRYFTGRELDSRLLQASKHESGDEWEISSLAQCDLLFIDDIDKVGATDRFKLQLFEIVNRRSISHRPTIITSNCEPIQLTGLLDGAVVSRIGDPSKWQIIQFPNTDLRKFNQLTF